MAKKRIQKLPAAASRVESGAVQFGDDWPGLFLRGDECLFLIADLRRMFEQLGADRLAVLNVGTGIQIATLLELIEKDVIVPRNRRKAYEAAADRRD